MTAALATMTSKHQITIPKELREDLKMKPGDKLVFAKKNSDWVLRNVAATPMELLKYLGRGLKGADVMAIHNEFEEDDEYR